MQGVSLCCSDAELESQLRFLGLVVEKLEVLEADVLESYAIKTETVNMWNRLMMRDRNSMYLNYTLRNILNILE